MANRQCESVEYLWERTPTMSSPKTVWLTTTTTGNFESYLKLPPQWEILLIYYYDFSNGPSTLKLALSGMILVCKREKIQTLTLWKGVHWLMNLKSTGIERSGRVQFRCSRFVRKPQPFSQSVQQSSMLALFIGRLLETLGLQSLSLVTQRKEGFSFSRSSSKNPKLIMIWLRLGHIPIPELIT